MVARDFDVDVQEREEGYFKRYQRLSRRTVCFRFHNGSHFCNLIHFIKMMMLFFFSRLGGCIIGHRNLYTVHISRR
ncbi:hypothetical protein CDEST_08629 [Colletotrichum destructivum]|uniref:Uncharacterized protein n=1 Tax=Colletotrichum destructivum TaxID=34406 RepID=A0AAX4IJR6_9PEZI|nr:hypothetical protein CDEST_08629 [Colletotrichum destructivum]